MLFRVRTGCLLRKDANRPCRAKESLSHTPRGATGGYRVPAVPQGQAEPAYASATPVIGVSKVVFPLSAAMRRPGGWWDVNDGWWAMAREPSLHRHHSHA